ncbi:hypothetical protein [Microbacterium candidum]|uniref:Lytic transglycosylase domain-containing protein n=1 Tax=Microbacterium candidum TaxID=3041922 RepID=A0ABT7N0Q3_9MICO|nr:hypothetical protein [Microbacterium sp. ASV49]MDL9980236.1 hypothetical protein [Microbacterium sp. ASV49]
MPSFSTTTRLVASAVLVAAAAVPATIAPAYASEIQPTVATTVSEDVKPAAANHQLQLVEGTLVIKQVEVDHDKLALGKSRILETGAYDTTTPQIVAGPYVPPPPAPPAPAPKPAPKPKPKQVAAPAPAPASIPAGDPRAIGQELAAQRGWGADQFACLNALWNRESGWRVNASNPSGAYGIPQALPGSKMGAGWQNNPVVQITWGLNYIAGRYGTPCGAWAHSQSTGWY